MLPPIFQLVCNRRHKWEIVSKCMKAARQILAGIAEQSVTLALVSFFEDVKKDSLNNWLLFIQCIRYDNKKMSFTPIQIPGPSPKFFSKAALSMK